MGAPLNNLTVGIQPAFSLKFQLWIYKVGWEKIGGPFSWGAPKVAFLKQFKKPNAFPAFSVQLYKKFKTTTMESLAKQ